MNVGGFRGPFLPKAQKQTDDGGYVRDAPVRVNVFVQSSIGCRGLRVSVNIREPPTEVETLFDHARTLCLQLIRPAPNSPRP